MSTIAINIKTNPFRPFGLIRGTQQSLTGNDPGRAMNSNPEALDFGVTGRTLRGIAKPVIIRYFFIPDEISLRRRLLVYCESKNRKIILRKFFLKFLWDKLSPAEYEAFILLAIEIGDEIILNTIKVSEEIPKNLLIARLNALCTITRRKPFLLREYLSSKGFLLLVDSEIIQAPSSGIERYTGWKRHQNDQGSLSPHKEDPFPLVPELIAEEFDILKALTVGVIHFSGEGSLMMALIKAETVIFNDLVKENLYDFQKRFRVS
jgi:hypothetical protein